MPKIHVSPANSDTKQQDDDSQEGDTGFVTFTESTSLHGIKHAFSRRNNRIRRFVWLCGVLAMTGLLTYIVTNLVIDYFKYPYVTSVVISAVPKLDFPQVTICNISPFNASRITSLNNYSRNFMLNNSPIEFLAEPFDIDSPEYNFTNMNVTKEYFEEISFSLPHSFLHCSFETNSIPCEEMLEPMKTDMGLCFTLKTNSTQGQQLRSTKMTGSENGLQLYAFCDQKNYVHSTQLSAGFKVFLHEPSEEPDINKGFLAAPGLASYASLKKIQKVLLPKPYKAFGTVECLDTKSPDFKNPMNYSDEYDVTKCFKECRAKFIFNKCGCVYYFDAGNYTLCTPKEFHLCYMGAKYDFIRLDKDEACNCMVPCETVSYESQQSTALFPSNLVKKVFAEKMGITNSKESYAEVRVFYEHLEETEIKQTPVYNFDNILATLGGQMGIFLGASVLTISEFLEYILIQIWCLCARREKKFQKQKPQG